MRGLKRIGLFGGTFNPIHSAHIQIACEIRDQFTLDTVYIIPSAAPPHKGCGNTADAGDRLEMTRLAISDHSNLMPSDIELNREGLSYTIDTVKHFRSILPKDHEIYLMMGIDAFMEIDTWKSYTELFDLMQLIVMARPGHWCKENTMQWHILKTYLSTKVSEGYSYCASRSAYVHGEKRPVFICNVSLLDISSTKIRQLVKNNRSINMFVPEKVEEYIIKKGLYQ